MLKMWPRYDPDLSMVYPRYAKDIFKVCPKYALDLPKICPIYDPDMPKTCPRYPQDMVGIGKSGVWQYGLVPFLEPCSNKKPKVSYTSCPNCVHLWWTLNELLWAFYEHFVREMSKCDDFPQNAWWLVCFLDPCSKQGQSNQCRTPGVKF